MHALCNTLGMIGIESQARAGARSGRAGILLAVAALSLLGAGSCAAAPPDATLRSDAAGPRLPGAWAAGPSSDGSAAGGWLAAFGDADLVALVDEALRNRPDLAAAAARVVAAAADAEAAGADRSPALSAALDSARRRSNARVPSLSGGEDVAHQTTTSHGISLDLSWEADLWGRLAAGEEAALADLAASRADLDGARLSLAAQIAKGWFSVTEARRQAEIAAETVESYRRTAELSRRRVEEGLVSTLDLRLARASLATAEASRAQRAEAYARETRRLEVLLGRPPAGRMTGAPVLPAPPAAPPAGLPADLLARRPDLVAAQCRVEAADRRLAASRAALLPRIRLTASGGTASDRLRDLVSGDFLVWTLAGSAVEPVFDGGRLRAQVSGADARAAAALSDYASRVLDALLEVETALAVDSLLEEREALLAFASAESAGAVRIAETRYREGADPVLTLLESRRRDQDGQSALLAARRARLENRINLYLALGGDFAAAPEEDR